MDQPASGWTETKFFHGSVNARSAIQHEIKLSAGDHLRWSYKAPEVAVEITFHSAGSICLSGKVIQTSSKADAKTPQVQGSFVLPNAGTVRFVLNNGFSLLRGKNYKIDVELVHRHLPAGSTVSTPMGSGVVQGYREEDDMYIVSLDYATGYLHRSSVFRPSSGSSANNDVNERAIYGTDLFFNNRFQECEEFFLEAKDKYLMYSMSLAAVSFVRAMMTWEKDDVKIAINRIGESAKFAAKFMPQEKGWVSWLVGSKRPPMTAEQLEACLITAECHQLMGVLQMTEESFSGAIKGALNMRSAFKYYSRCYEEVKDVDPAKLDRSTISGVEFGMGTFNLVNSVLPPIVIKIVSALGFPSEREKGLQMLKQSAERGGTRSALAALAYMSFRIVVPSFYFSARQEEELALGEEVLNTVLQRYPDGALFWWMAGRLWKMRCQLDRAIDAFERAARGQTEWIQLQHLCCYELGWCHFLKLDFAAAEPLFGRLYKENKWSKAFYVYMQAVCCFEQGKEEEASAWCAKVAPAVERTFGGRILDLEQFVMRRAANYLKDRNRKPFLPGLEMNFLYNNLHQMSSEAKDKALTVIKTEADRMEILLKDAKRDAGARQQALENLRLAQLMRGTLLKAMGQEAEAEQFLKIACDNEAEVKEERYIVPFGRFELATLLLHTAVKIGRESRAPSLETSPASETSSPPSSSSSSTAPSAPLSPPVSTKSASSASARSGSSTTLLAKQLEFVQRSEHMYRKAKAFKPDFNFKYRLHLRVHLALQELDRLRQELIRASEQQGVKAAELLQSLQTDEYQDKDEDLEEAAPEGIDVKLAHEACEAAAENDMELLSNITPRAPSQASTSSGGKS